MALSEEEVEKNHAQLRHCSGNTLPATIRAAKMHFDLAAMQKMLTKCGRQTAVQRITLPPVASWMGKYNGDAIALDIICPFADCFEERIAEEFPSLFTIGSLSRFINCSLLIARASARAGQLFLEEWVRNLGKPRRIIADKGGTALSGKT